jgi:hypothetical protein
MGNSQTILVGKPLGNKLQDLDDRMILKWVLMEQDVKACTAIK